MSTRLVSVGKQRRGSCRRRSLRRFVIVFSFSKLKTKNYLRLVLYFKSKNRKNEKSHLDRSSVQLVGDSYCALWLSL